MSINMSILRKSTHPGYFWFPNLDLVIPLKPRQVMIFQGIECHTGSPVLAHPNAPETHLSYDYGEEVRVNVICYPSRKALNLLPNIAA